MHMIYFSVLVSMHFYVTLYMFTITHIRSFAL